MHGGMGEGEHDSSALGSTADPALAAQTALQHLRIIIDVEKFKRGHFHGAHVSDSTNGGDGVRQSNSGDAERDHEQDKGSGKGGTHSRAVGATSSSQARYRRALSRERSTSVAAAIAAASLTTATAQNAPVGGSANIDVSLQHAASRRHRALSELFGAVRALCVRVHGANPLLREDGNPSPPNRANSSTTRSHHRARGSGGGGIQV